MAISTIGASALDSGVSQLGKNLIINGAHTVDQRSGDTRTGLGTSGQYISDRWQYDAGSSPSARWTASVESGGGLNGKSNWLKFLCTTADGSPSTNEKAQVRQAIEAQSISGPALDSSGDLKQLTLSMDIIAHADGASSVTFPAKAAVGLFTADGTQRQIISDVTIAADATWERVSVTFPADATASIDHNTGAGLWVHVALYGGSDRQGTADTWFNFGNDIITADTDNWADATNNYIGFTNVQLEVGSVSTDFQHEDIGTTFAKCLRYFWRYEPTNEVSQNICVCFSQSVGTVTGVLRYPVIMRAAPSAATTAAATFEVLYNNGGSLAQSDCTGINVGQIRVDQATLFFGVSSDPFTIGEAAIGRRDSTDTTRIDLSAEL
jgi:hypothetical protein